MKLDFTIPNTLTYTSVISPPSLIFLTNGSIIKLRSMDDKRYLCPIDLHGGNKQIFLHLPGR